MSEVYIKNFKLNNELNTTKLPSFQLEKSAFQFSLPLRPNICVTCLTCLTCAGKYGTNDCHCPASEIQWNKKKQGYEVEFRRRSIIPNNRVFMTWLKANLSQRLIWDETCKEVKLCMSCNSICRRWAKVFNEDIPSNKPASGGCRFRSSRFSPTKSSSISKTIFGKRVQDCIISSDNFSAPLSSFVTRNSVTYCQEYIKSDPEQILPPPLSKTTLPLNINTRRANSVRDTPPSFGDDDRVYQSSSPSPSPRLQTPSNGDFAPLVTYNLAQLVASASPKEIISLKTVTLRMGKRIIKDRIVIDSKMTFNDLIQRAILSNLPAGKRYVIKSMDKQYEYLPDDFIVQTFHGLEHVELSLDQEEVPSINLNDFDLC